MDAETGPMRCDSSLSMIKIQPVNDGTKSKQLFSSHKFSDPEIEELYQLHSANQKRTELFRCFLYAILFYCLAHTYTYSVWISTHNNALNGIRPNNHTHTHFDHLDNDTMHDDSSEVDYGNGHTDPRALPQADYPWKSVRNHRSVTSKRLFSPNTYEHQDDLHSSSHLGGRHAKSRKTNPHSHSKSVFYQVESTGIKRGESEWKDESPLHSGKSTNNNNIGESPAHKSDGEGSLQSSSNHKRRIKSLVRRNAMKTKESPAVLHSYQRFVGDGLEMDRVDLLSKNMWYIAIMMVLLVVTGSIILLMLLPLSQVPKNAHIPTLLWTALIIFSISVDIEASVHPRLALGWAILETFLIWVTLPLRIRAAFFYTISVTSLYIIVTGVRENNSFKLGNQLGANIVLLIMTNLMGLVSFYLSDKKQRRAFIDSRHSMEMKLVIEEQAMEQERLLLSVLPEHLALKMRQDLGAAVDGQFKKIYMSRHENVSILYADIVGFTAISSMYSASELVKILNELFARFDRLAEKYSQIRIKILGDCYYCICGAPEERPDHATLCVHMGLSMVKAIKYVREKTKSSVDMRVGIHTGAILAGVLGKRQWQFDIYSQDVILANKMESSGQAGRVHVSNVTLSFMNNEFEVEPAHGEKREEYLRIAGIKTYFIVRPLVPFKETKPSVISENGDVQIPEEITKDMPSDLMSTVAEDSNSAGEETGASRKKSDLEAYRARLKEELLSRDGFKDLSRQSQWLTLKFQDAEKEAEFTKHKDPYAGIYTAVCPCALVAVGVANFFAISFNILGLIVLILGVVLLGLLSSFAACDDSPLKSRIMKLSGILHSVCSLESELWMRRLVSILSALLLIAANLAFLVPCLVSGDCYEEVGPPLVLPKASEQSSKCLFPVYSIAFETVFLLSMTLLPYLGSWVKSFIILVVTAVHIVLIYTDPLKQLMECSERLYLHDEDRLIPADCYLALFGIVVLFDLLVLTRRFEKSSRVLFLWKTEVESQRETATQLRQKNEALVYNILPIHVAAHFLGSRRRKHEELYSQSYSEVGILFASMPNFSDFYSEETVNNQGLECLRFLNEVIYEFDSLLEDPRFADTIIKIKTIGSTYMAASGLNPSKQAHPEDPIIVRWRHLALLVEFALEMKRALNDINEQSFNHFVLKMGINHGPITAGVIGARKPHYDIWGNSVNVASRMESTGRSGCIQVTTETYRILRLYGYLFEQRGLVNVKGKGQLMTYYLINKGPEPNDDELKGLLAALEEGQTQSEENLLQQQQQPPPQ